MSMMLFAVLAAGCGGGEDQAGGKAATQKFINIATGGTAGTYYPLGGAIADILNKNIPGCNASAQATGASIANINMLQQGQVDIAFIQNDNAYYAVNGTEMFKDEKSYQPLWPGNSVSGNHSDCNPCRNRHYRPFPG